VLIAGRFEAQTALPGYSLEAKGEARVKFVFDSMAVRTFERISGVGAYIDLSEQSLPLVEARQREKLEQQARDEAWDYEDYRLETLTLDERFRFWLPRLSAYSGVILLQSAVELQLFECAERVGRTMSCAIQPRDMLSGRGGSAHAAVTYLRKVANVHVSDDPSWPRLKDLESLRNIVVHRAGERGKTEDHQKEFDRLVKTYGPGLSEGESPSKFHSQISVSLVFCREMVEEVSVFFARVLMAIGVAKEAIPRKYRTPE
jgi:hypothetical protein